MPMTKEEIKNQKCELLLEYSLIKEKVQELKFEKKQVLEEILLYKRLPWYMAFFWWMMGWDKLIEPKIDWLMVSLLDPLFDSMRQNNEGKWIRDNIYIIVIFAPEYSDVKWYGYLAKICSWAEPKEEKPTVNLLTFPEKALGQINQIKRKDEILNESPEINISSNRYKK